MEHIEKIILAVGVLLSSLLGGVALVWGAVSKGRVEIGVATDSRVVECERECEQLREAYDELREAARRIRHQAADRLMALGDAAALPELPPLPRIGDSAP